MNRFGACCFSLAVVAATSGRARSAEFDVPITHATLQAAVIAAAASADLENTITISASPVMTAASIDFGAAFGPGRHLLVRPAAGLSRASIVNTTPGTTVINMTSAGFITLQDLDIVRNITNNQHILVLNVCESVVIERCRIGSNWTTGGLAGWANVHITYPTEIVLRNNICFARTAGTFEYGIDAGSFNDPANSLRLYNNVVSDYRTYGVRIEAAISGPLVLLRNNVVVNHGTLLPEPVAFRTHALIGGPTVATSHNAVFATAGFEQTGPAGTQDIAGLGMSFVALLKPDVFGSFVDHVWSVAPPWDANANFYRLVDRGPLHDAATDYGMTVSDVPPDIAVLDDIELDVRPGGANPHTDRGADQIEPGVAADVGAIDGKPERLEAFARWSSDDRLLVEYRVTTPGRLEFELFDLSGRLLHRDTRDVRDRSEGVLEWSTPRSTTLTLYRLRLHTAEGRIEQVSGKAVRVR